MNKAKITIVGTPIWKLPKGHKSRRGGAGSHADRRQKRLHTRGTRLREALYLER